MRNHTRSLSLPRSPKPNKHSKDLLHMLRNQTTYHFLHHENPPTWAGIEPAILGLQGQCLNQFSCVIQPPGQPIGVTVHFTQQPIREQPLSSQPSQKLFQIHHPDEAPKPCLPDPIDHPIAVMPPSRISGHISLVIKVSDRAWHVMSSNPVPPKTRRVEQRCTLNLSRAQASSRWCSVVIRRGSDSSGVVLVT
ncbi:hypothetical protein TNCV_2195551 [Trichonephila clavipes]|nr:hypothetical protein TNCV_2195551 [Trichonephila clavipes]